MGYIKDPSQSFTQSCQAAVSHRFLKLLWLLPYLYNSIYDQTKIDAHIPTRKVLPWDFLLDIGQLTT